MSSGKGMSDFTFFLPPLIFLTFIPAMSKLTSRRMAHIREELTDRCSSILLGYRRNCAAATAVSQASPLDIISVPFINKLRS